MDSKPWYLSKTILGGIVAFIGALLNALHVTSALMSSDLQAQVINIALEVIGFVMVLYGRVTAETRIK